MRQTDRTTQTDRPMGRQAHCSKRNRQTQSQRDRWEYRQTVVSRPRKQTCEREAGRQAECRRETDGRTQKFQKRGKYGLQIGVVLVWEFSQSQLGFHCIRYSTLMVMVFVLNTASKLQNFIMYSQRVSPDIHV